MLYRRLTKTSDIFVLKRNPTHDIDRNTKIIAWAEQGEKSRRGRIMTSRVLMNHHRIKKNGRENVLFHNQIQIQRPIKYFFQKNDRCNAPRRSAKLAFLFEI
jgi:hypothetical protein